MEKERKRLNGAFSRIAFDLVARISLSRKGGGAYDFVMGLSRPRDSLH
jgi:hypothetical protein